MTMRYFTLHRMEDATGVSGTGVVAWGVRWPDGSCSLRWLGKTPSFVNYEGVPSASQLQRVGDEHVKIVHGHHGKTVLVWDNGSIKAPKKEDVDAVEKDRECGSEDCTDRVKQKPTPSDKEMLKRVRKRSWWRFW